MVSGLVFAWYNDLGQDLAEHAEPSSLSCKVLGLRGLHLNALELASSACCSLGQSMKPRAD